MSIFKKLIEKIARRSPDDFAHWDPDARDLVDVVRRGQLREGEIVEWMARPFPEGINSDEPKNLSD